jgi:hypothetical protein
MTRNHQLILALHLASRFGESQPRMDCLRYVHALLSLQLLYFCEQNGKPGASLQVNLVAAKKEGWLHKPIDDVSQF